MKGVCFVCEKKKEIVSHRRFKYETELKPLCEDCDYEYEESIGG